MGTLLPNNTVTVQLQDFLPVECQLASSIFSSLLGFKTTQVPVIGSSVLVFYAAPGQCYVIGGYPDATTDPTHRRTLVEDRTALYGDLKSFKDRRSPSSWVSNSHKPPADLVEGEVQIDNLLGVGLSLLRNLASLQAGDLAKVECCLMDDMVRIISDTFKHHTAFGDYRIYNDGGRLNCVWDGTSFDHEAWGIDKEGDPRAALKPGTKDALDTHGPVDGFNDDGRWRFSQYVGWVGNFIHMFVTDPVEHLGRLASDRFRAGRAKVHVHMDGSVLIQSVTEIAIEKVVCIPVPNPIRRPDDPQGNRTDAAGTSPPPPPWKPPGGDLFETVFQLRDYARWLSNSHALSRFHQLPRDYQVPAENKVPLPKGDNQAFDNSAQENPKFKLAYACFRIYRDGSVQTVDAYGNSFTSTKTGIQISSTQDILLEAAGSVNIVAGRDFNVTARQNMTLTALTGAFRLFVKKQLQLMSETSGMILQLAKGLRVTGDVVLNKSIQFTANGAADFLGVVTAARLAAQTSNGAFGHSPHMFHIFPGFPQIRPPGDDDLAKFEFPKEYGGSPLYMTFSQQAMVQGEASSGGSWTPATSAGAAWPGNIQVASFPTTNSLNKVLTTALPTNKPGDRADTDVQWRYQT